MAESKFQLILDGRIRGGEKHEEAIQRLAMLFHIVFLFYL